jgi:enolase-phosphatase E1
MLTIVLDIEGTTSSTSFVVATLYPYSSARFESELLAHPDDPEIRQVIDQTCKLAGEPTATPTRVAEVLREWLAIDRKATPLKTLQGRIWAKGFEAGDLHSHFYADAIPAIRGWHADGHRLVIFSSGSITAQHTWFGNTPEGNLLPLFDAHFDTINGGPKRVASSYEHIAAALQEDPADLVFFSDLVDELDAARTAGWHTVGVVRDGEPYAAQGVGSHLRITRFDQVTLAGRSPNLRSSNHP